MLIKGVVNEKDNFVVSIPLSAFENETKDFSKESLENFFKSFLFK